MNRSWCALFPAILLAAAVLAAVAPVTAEERSFVDEVMEVSRVRQDIENMPRMFLAGLLMAQQQGQPIEGLGASELERVVFKGFERSGFLPLVRAELEGKLGAAKLERLRNWYQEPFPKRLIELEKELANPEDFDRLQAFAGELAAKPLAPSRVALLEKLDRTVGLTAQSLQTTSLIMATAFRVFDRLAPPARQQGEAALKKMEEGALAQLTTNLPQQTLVQLAFLYRSLDDQELATFVADQEQEFLREFHDAVKVGLDKGLAAFAAGMLAEADDLVKSRSAHPTEKAAPPTAGQ
ncbi:MAG: hypothetical protein GX442_15400 [Candidatus Riflebacteria bacterium]|nr:hypothetical protein [Candidatus Riflebacteria bacterium]